MKTILTIEQSATLISKGVSTERASAFDDIRTVIDGVPTFCPGTKPLFTLTDLLSLLPKEIDGCDLTIGANKEEWRVAYELNELDDDDNFVIIRTIMIQFAKELIDALFLALCDCLKNDVKLD